MVHGFLHEMKASSRERRLFTIGAMSNITLQRDASPASRLHAPELARYRAEISSAFLAG